MLFTVEHNNKQFEVDVAEENGGLAVKWKKKKFNVVLDSSKRCIKNVAINNKILLVGWHKKDNIYDIELDGNNYQFLVENSKYKELRIKKKQSVPNSGKVEILAPIPGLVTEIKVKIGAEVKKDESLLTLNAMKLENEILSPASGIVKKINVKQGQTVEKGLMLIMIDS